MVHGGVLYEHYSAVYVSIIGQCLDIANKMLLNAVRTLHTQISRTLGQINEVDPTID